MNYKLIISILLFIFSFKFFYLQSEEILKLYYIIIIIILFFIPIKFSLIYFFSFIIFIPQSIWYSQLKNQMLTPYEIEIFGIKFIELLIYFLFLKVIINFYKNKVKYYNSLDNKINKEAKIIIILWFSVIVYSILRGLFLDNSVYDIFLFAEFRTLLLGLCLLFILLIYFNSHTNEITKLLDIIYILIFIKLVIILPEYLFGNNFILLWPITAKNYIGNLNSYFGADSDIYIVLFVLFFLFLKIIYNKKNKIDIFFALIYVLSIIISFRRGPLIGIFIILLYLFITFNVINKIVIFYNIILLSLLFIFGFNIQSIYLSSFYNRIIGNDEKVQQSNFGHLMDIQDSMNDVLDAPILGKGLGHRFDLIRMKIQNKRESITTHSGILQSWVKFGIFGLFIYLYTFFKVLIISLRLRKSKDYYYLLGARMFLFSSFLWELFTPPFYQGFRKTTFIMFSIALILSIIDNKNKKQINEKYI